MILNHLADPYTRLAAPRKNRRRLVRSGVTGAELRQGVTYLGAKKTTTGLVASASPLLEGGTVSSIPVRRSLPVPAANRHKLSMSGQERSGQTKLESDGLLVAAVSVGAAILLAVLALRWGVYRR